ncbi:MAG TPA: RluA family pseudouridine synthase [Steroidobacteraceae bacterium]|nr:RluA family pseudouridine synthase [Steroidobacteraceae bacterium]
MTSGRTSPTGVRRLRAGAAGEGQRLDNFLLRELAGVPKSRVYRLLRRGEVRVNGKRKGPEYRLAADDELRLPPVRLDAAGASPKRRAPDALQATVRAAILHEDARVLVLDKPAGLAVHGGSGLAFGAIEALRALRPQEPLELAHRLDRDTSGCLLVARTRQALRMLHALLREGRVEKHYAALVAGRWRLGRKTIDAPVLTRQRQGGERVVRVHAAGKLAISEFAPRESFGQLATLMDVAIRTGRTHQIRVHAAFAGHPVAGDDKYGDRAANAKFAGLGLRRMFLHAASVAFTWPDSGAAFRATAPLPRDLETLLTALREYSPRP